MSGEADGGVEQWRRTRLEQRGRDGGGVGAALLAKVGGDASEEEGDGMGGGRRGKRWRWPELERRFSPVSEATPARKRSVAVAEERQDGWRQRRRRRGGRRRRKRLVGYGMEELSTEAYRESSPPWQPPAVLQIITLPTVGPLYTVGPALAPARSCYNS